MKRDGEDRLLNHFQRMECEDPYERLNCLLEELYQQGDFVYAMDPHPGTSDDGPGIREPVYIRLSRN